MKPVQRRLRGVLWFMLGYCVGACVVASYQVGKEAASG